MKELFEKWLDGMRFETSVTLVSTAMAVSSVGIIIALIVGIAQII